MKAADDRGYVRPLSARRLDGRLAASRGGSEQDMGWYTSLAKAKAGAQRDHAKLEKTV